MIASSLGRVTVGALLWIAGSAGAAPLVVSFTGTVATGIVGFSAGSPASGSFLVDDVDHAPDSTGGVYDGPTDVTFTFAGHVYTSPGHPTDPDAFVSITDQVAMDGIVLQAKLVSGGSIDAYTPYRLQLEMSDPDATALSSDAFPASVTAGDFESRIATIIYTDGANFIGLTADIATFTVPEPAAAGWIAIAALTLARLGRRAA